MAASFSPVAMSADRAIAARERLNEWRFCELLSRGECDISDKIREKIELAETKYASELRELSRVLMHLGDTPDGHGCTLSFARRVYVCAHNSEYKIEEMSPVRIDGVMYLDVKIGVGADTHTHAQTCCAIPSPLRVRV